MAPEVTGQVFPEHEHREYPKVLYPGGESHDANGRPNEGRVVGGVDEEREAREAGFAPVVAGCIEAAEEVPAEEPTGGPCPVCGAEIDEDGEGHEHDCPQAGLALGDIDGPALEATPPGPEGIEEDSPLNEGEADETFDLGPAPKTLAELEGAADANADGHDDTSGEFVPGPTNTGRRSPRRRR